MATTFALAAYTLHVHKKRDPKTLQPLDNFDGAGGDLLVLLHAYHNWVSKNPIHHRGDKRLFEVLSVSRRKRRLNIKTETGDYGLESRLRNVRTGTDTAKRTTDDAELLLLRNSFFVPKAKDKALLLTERVGRRGQVSIFSRTFKDAFAARFPGYMLVIEAVAPAEAIAESFEHGGLKSITLSKHSIPPDVADRFKMSDGVELGTMATVIRAKKGTFFSRNTSEEIEKALGDPQVRRSLLTVGAEEYNELRVQLQVGSSVRNVDVSNSEGPKVTFPFDTTGRPADADVWSAAGTVAEDLAPYFGLTNALDQPFTWSAAHKGLELPVPADLPSS
jgi:hypothetical protein